MNGGPAPRAARVHETGGAGREGPSAKGREDEIPRDGEVPRLLARSDPVVVEGVTITRPSGALLAGTFAITGGVLSRTGAGAGS